MAKPTPVMSIPSSQQAINMQPCTSHVDCSTPADGISEDKSSQALPSRLQAITPEDSFASASGFYSPKSHMASRQQSASSSDAWFDAHSQMARRASSVSTPGTSAALPAAMPAGIVLKLVLHALKYIQYCPNSWCLQLLCPQNLLACNTLQAASNEKQQDQKLLPALAPGPNSKWVCD